MAGLRDDCPKFYEYLFPVLRLLSDGEERTNAEIREAMATHFQLSDAARLERTQGGTVTKHADRSNWALTYLRQAGLIISHKRGAAVISEDGKGFFAENKSGFGLGDLQTLPKFIEFKNRTKEEKSSKQNDDNIIEKSGQAPQDMVEAASKTIEGDLAVEIRDRLAKNSPTFFEEVIVKLLEKMGYGSGEAVGRAGDGGIDGIVNQDKLGLNRILVQAKRHQSNIGPGDIRDFSGAIGERKASSGLFVTTADFSPAAIDAAKNADKLIVLINGDGLARLMIKHGIGCITQNTFVIRTLDEDYFPD